MVYVDPKDLGYEPFWQKWVNERTMGEQEELLKLYRKFVPGCIDLICEGIRDGKPGEKLKTIVPLTNLNMVIRHCYNRLL
jgi:dynein heavy chain